MSQETLFTNELQRRKEGKLKLQELRELCDISPRDFFIALSPCDFGVQQNLGRLGARFAPQSIMNAFSNLSRLGLERTIFYKNFFERAKDLTSYKGSIEKSVESFSQAPIPAIHLGGGHDHIYPLLQGLFEQGRKKTLIINIDPHCDTRENSFPHSGNPFRRFVEGNSEWKGKLLQVGVDPMNNDAFTFSGVSGMEVINFDNLSILSKSFTDTQFIEEVNKEDYEHVVISLDADVIEGSFMEGVSSVSYKGLPANFVRDLTLTIARAFFIKKVPCTLGIYEYNPLFENLSCKGSRFFAGLMYDFLKRYPL